MGGEAGNHFNGRVFCGFVLLFWFLKNFFTLCLEVALHFWTLRLCEDILLALALEHRA